MKKIKINERQASLIKSLSINQGKKIYKITKEQYNRIFAEKLITESDDVKGGNHRVEKTFKKSFSGADVQNLDEDNFNIKKPNTDIPKLNKQVMNRGPIDEAEGSNQELHQAVAKLIHDIYNNPEQAGIDPYWEKVGLSWDDIETYLSNEGLLIQNGETLSIAKKHKGLAFTSPSDAIKAIEEKLNTLIQKKGHPATETKELETEDSGYPAGAQDAPEAPYNQKDNSVKPVQASAPKLDIVAFNNEIAIFKDDSGSLYVFYHYDINKKDLGDYAERTRSYAGRADNGEPDFEYSDDFEVDANTINHYVNDNLKSLTKGEGADAFEQGVQLVKIDDALKNELLSVYDKDKSIVKVLGPIQEEEKPSDHQIAKDKLTTGIPTTTPTVKTTPEKIKSALAKLRDDEMNRRKTAGEMEETSAAGGSSGAFTGPLNAPIIKKDMPIAGDVPVIGEETIDEVTVAGSSATGGSSGPYDANALLGIGRNGEFKTPKKTKAQSNTQYPNGGFVEIGSCAKANNNKAAENGKCSQGAVDSVVKVKKAGTSIITPSLSEGIHYEGFHGTAMVISERTGKTIKEVERLMIVSQKTGKTVDEVIQIIESKLKSSN